MRYTTHYWLPDKDENFITYTKHKHPMAYSIEGITKNSVPDDISIPSEFPETIQKAKEWFEMSNIEDLYVLEKEKEAFDLFYFKEKEEILNSL